MANFRYRREPSSTTLVVKATKERERYFIPDKPSEIELPQLTSGTYVPWLEVPPRPRGTRWRVAYDLPSGKRGSIRRDTTVAQTRRVADQAWREEMAYNRRIEAEPYVLVTLENQDRGPAELVRLVFAAAGEVLEEEKVSEEDWQMDKGSTPYGELPVVKKDGVTWGELSAIVRTFATKFLLLGLTNHEHIVVEATYERLRRLQSEHWKLFLWITQGDKNKDRMELAVNHLTHVVLPDQFKEWEAQILLSPGPFLVASGLTMADLAIYDVLETLSQNMFLEPILIDFPAVSDLWLMVQRFPAIRLFMDERDKSQTA